MRYLGFIITGLIFVIFYSCDKEENIVEYFVLSTNEVQIEGSTVNGVILSASVILKNDDVLVEQGFVYGVNRKPNLNNDWIIKTTDVTANTFAMEIEDALLPDTTYYVRSFLKTEEYLVYGNEVSFFSNGSDPPLIEKIEPNEAFWGDTVMIIGKNFDNAGKANSVWFDTFESLNTWGTRDTIYAIVPIELNRSKSQISIELYGKKSSNTKTFQILAPIIESISQTEGQYPDTVSIKGKNFFKPYGEILFGDYSQKIDIVDFTSREIQFVVPFLGEKQDVDLKIQQLQETIAYDKKFRYRGQAITGVSADGMYATDTITVYSENIDFRKVAFDINIGESVGTILRSWKDSMQFFPENIYSNLSDAEFNLEFNLKNNLGQETKVYETILTHKDPLISLTSNNFVPYCGRLELNEYGVYNQTITLWFENVEIGAPTSVEIPYSGFIEDHRYFRHIDSQMVPGKYEIWIESFGRLSNRVEIEVKTPIITSLSNENIANRADERITVTGSYLPVRGSYILKQPGNEFEFVVSRNKQLGMLMNEEIYLNAVAGAGLFELFIEMGGQLYSTGWEIMMDDYLQPYLKFDLSTSFGYRSFAFINNGKLYYHGTSRNQDGYVDLNTGIQRKMDDTYYPASVYNANPYPIHYKDKAYAIFENKLYSFNSSFEKWEEEIFNFQNDTLLTGCVVGGKLMVFARSGRSYVKDESWNDGPFIETIKGSSYKFAFASDDRVYFWDSRFYAMKSVSISTWEFQENFSAPVSYQTIARTPQHIFVKNGEIYLSYKASSGNYPKILKFSPANNEYKMLEPDFLPGKDYYYIFATDANENIFVVYLNHIYQFNPK